MRLPPDDQYSYNRYLDYVRYKASEAHSLKLEVEEYVETKIKKGVEKGLVKGLAEVAKNAIAAGLDDKLISELTGLSSKQLAEVRRNLIS